MLPGLRFFLSTLVLAISVLIFGLGAAALLRATHDEFASLPALRMAAPQPPPRGLQAAAAPPVLALLQVATPLAAPPQASTTAKPEQIVGQAALQRGVTPAPAQEPTAKPYATLQETPPQQPLQRLREPAKTSQQEVRVDPAEQIAPVREAAVEPPSAPTGAAVVLPAVCTDAGAAPTLVAARSGQAFETDPQTGPAPASEPASPPAEPISEGVSDLEKSEVVSEPTAETASEAISDAPAQIEASALPAVGELTAPLAAPISPVLLPQPRPDSHEIRRRARLRAAAAHRRRGAALRAALQARAKAAAPEPAKFELFPPLFGGS